MGTIQRIGVLALSLGLSACGQIASSQLNNTQIYTAYTASFDDFTQELSFTATFTVGGSPETYVALTGTSSVSVDGVPMTENTDIINQVTYTYSLVPSQAVLEAIHTFVYVDNYGKTYTNTVAIPLDIDISTVTGTPISMSHIFTVNWTSQDVLQSTDEVSMTIQRSDESGEASSEDFGTGSTAGEVTFTPQQLEPLGQGAYRLIACRDQNLPPAETPEVGGSMSVSRCLTEVPVTLTP